MKKLKTCSIKELDQLTNHEMSKSSGGTFIKNDSGPNQVGVDVKHDPVGVTGISVGRSF